MEVWKFGEKSILNLRNPNVSCGEIFQAVCDELGRHYEPMGFKYARSRPKLTKKFGHLKIEISFWSSRSNMPGEYVCFEIIPNIYTTILKEKKGYLWGHPNMFRKNHVCDEDYDVLVKNILDEDITRKDPNYTNLMIYSNNLNVYGLDELGFMKVVSFIDQHVLLMASVLQNADLLKELLQSLHPDGRNHIFKNGHPLLEYIEIMFPNLHNSLEFSEYRAII